MHIPHLKNTYTYTPGNNVENIHAICEIQPHSFTQGANYIYHSDDRAKTALHTPYVQKTENETFINCRKTLSYPNLALFYHVETVSRSLVAVTLGFSIVETWGVI
jgi:hypothetical protein